MFDETCIMIYPTAPNPDIQYYMNNNSWEYLSPNIHIKPQSPNLSFQVSGVSGTSTGNFHLNAFNNDLTITASSSTVEKYHLFELSLSYPDIKDRIENFLNPLNNYKPTINNSSSPYESAFNLGTIINPYDPDHISVDAIFWKPSANTNGEIIHGFYYKEFQRGINEFGEPDWIESISDEWKIRFAPDTIGTYYYYVHIWIGGKLVAQSELMSFESTNTTDPGYVKVASDPGENKQYLKFQNPNDSTFIPIGNNYAWTLGDYSGKKHINKTIASDVRMRPNGYGEITDALNRLSGSVSNQSTLQANATRLVFAPWSFHIEREKLNNYNDRQVEMWELDNYMSFLEGKDIYLTLGLILQGEFEWDKKDSLSTVDWRFNPYHDTIASTDPTTLFKGIPGVNSPKEFYTDPEARLFFKKRLRYIQSRWGYSKNLMLYELHSEIDNTNFFQNREEPTILELADFKDWYDDMAGFMKNSLKCKQLISVSIGRGASYNWGTASIWQDPYIDLVLPHIYNSRETDVSLAKKALTDIETSLTSANTQKPIFIQECNVDVYRDDIQYCTDLEYHKRNWAYNFIGSCGVLFWDFAFLNPTSDMLATPDPVGYFTGNIGSKTYESEYYKNLTGLRSFLSDNGMNLRTQRYTHTHKYGPIYNTDPWYEIVYSVSEDKKQIFGWFRNRSSNFYNCDDCINNFIIGKQPTTVFPLVTNVSDIWKYNCTPLPILADKSYDPRTWYTRWPVTNTFNDPINCSSIDLPDNILNPGDDNYNKAFNVQNGGYPTNSVMILKTVGNLMMGKGIQSLSIDQLDPSGYYTVQWYWTWDPDGNLANGNLTGTPFTGDKLVASNLVNGQKLSINGVISFSAPPTIKYGTNGKLYPGDWAFIIKKTGTKSVEAVEIKKSTVNFDATLNPNPTKGLITLTVQSEELDYSVELLDSKGNRVLNWENIKDEILTIDISSQSNGVYFLRVINLNCLKTIKVIKI